MESGSGTIGEKILRLGEQKVRGGNQSKTKECEGLGQATERRAVPHTTRKKRAYKNTKMGKKAPGVREQETSIGKNKRNPVNQ